MKENMIHASAKRQNPKLLKWEVTICKKNTPILYPICRSTKWAAYTYKWLVIHLRDKHTFPAQNPVSVATSYKAAIIFYLASLWNLYSYLHTSQHLRKCIWEFGTLLSCRDFYFGSCLCEVTFKKKKWNRQDKNIYNQLRCSKTAFITIYPCEQQHVLSNSRLKLIGSSSAFCTPTQGYL